jgi:hypothetical protein
MFPSRYMPCPNCGDSLERRQASDHVCAAERRLDYQMFQLRGHVERLDAQFGAYLETRRGQFERWYAERRRRRLQ